MPPGPTKREAERIQILGELRGEVMVFQPMTIREIGREGITVETGFPFHLDSLHEFRLALGDLSIVVKGRIVHCSITDVEQELGRRALRVSRRPGVAKSWLPVTGEAR